MGKLLIKDPKLTTANNFFSKDENKSALQIPLDLIDPFPNHPFHVVQDEALEQLAQSIAENGVYNKVILRPKENGRYELISGHRRVAASRLAGKDTVPAVVEDMDDARATIMMIDSNLRQRQQILPSEKAFAYKMKLDAIRKRSGERTDLTCGQRDHKSPAKRSRDVIAEESGESAKQISRYIRLTELIPELLALVDSGKLPINPAVELSYIGAKQQEMLLDIMKRDESAPTLEQARALRAAAEKGDINHTIIDMLMGGRLKQPDKVSIPVKTIGKYYSPTATPKQIEESMLGLAAMLSEIRRYFPANAPQEEITKAVIRQMREQYERKFRS